MHGTHLPSVIALKNELFSTELHKFQLYPESCSVRTVHDAMMTDIMYS